jgi:proline dehydrogenase
MRTFFLFLSRQKQLRKWMETSRWARRLSARFIAGDNLQDALTTCQRINAEGISVTLDHLGENVTSLEEAAASRDAYLRALTEMGRLQINGNVSL